MQKLLVITAFVFLGCLTLSVQAETPPIPRAKPLDLGGITIAAKTEKSCAKILDGLDMQWRSIPAIGNKGSCGTEFPVLVSAIQGVKIVPEATFNCEMAARVYQWIAGDVIPAAKKELGQELISIQNASSYVCRRRNGQATGKLSEHAIANAFDIASFKFADGSETTVAGNWSGLLQSIGLSKRGAFLRASRKNACAIFTTVLGPGSDQYHGDHFHVDLAKRKRGYRICK